jgi:hypothetical protein
MKVEEKSLLFIPTTFTSKNKEDQLANQIEENKTRT